MFLDDAVSDTGGIKTDVCVLDRIGIDNSFSGCTGVDVTTGVDASNGSHLLKFCLLPHSRRLW
jgi:hypothetical protein